MAKPLFWEFPRGFPLLLSLMLYSPVALAREPEAPLVSQENSQTAPLLQEEGSLSPGDTSVNIRSGGPLYDTYSFEGRAGQSVTISVESEEFDTYLILVDADGKKLAENDDSDNSSNSALTATLPEDGTYNVIVSGQDVHSRGRYALSISPAAEADIRRAAADRLYQEGAQLYGQQTTESLRGAIVKWAEAWLIYRELGDLIGEAKTLAGLGRVYSNLGNKQQALSYYDRALLISQQVGSQTAEANILNNIGNVYEGLGEQQEALSYYNRALLLVRQAGDLRREAIVLGIIARVHSNFGDKQQALSYYNQALPLYRQTNYKKGEAATLNNIGGVYSDLGDKQEALSYYNRALSLYQQAGDISGEARTLNNIGWGYFDLGDQQEALSYLKQALPLYQRSGNISGEARTLNWIGRVYFSLGDKQKAVDYFKQALTLHRQIGDIPEEARTLSGIGRFYSDLGEKQEALSYLNQALTLARQVGDKAGEARSLNNIGGVYSDLGEKQEALSYHDRALTLYRQVGDKAGEARTLNSIGRSYFDLGDKQEALSYYNRALTLARQAGNKAVEARSLTGIGLVYDTLGDKQEALSYYDLALPLYRQTGDVAGEAATLDNIGIVHSDLGEKQKALSYHERALPVLRQAGDLVGEARALNNIGLVYSQLGDQQKALSYLNQAFPLYRQAGYKQGEASILNNIGRVYNYLGEKQEALSYFKQSLPLSQQAGDISGEAFTLNNVGFMYYILGDLKQALSNYNQALSLFQQADDPAGEATALSNIGRVQSDLGDKQQALSYYDRALRLDRQTGNISGEAATLNNIGLAYSDLGDKQQEQALSYYNQALPLSRQVGDRTREAAILRNIAVFKRDRSQLEEALTKIEEAIAIVEDLRVKIASQELRTSYFAQYQDYYEFYIDLLMELHWQNPDRGYDGRALHASERSRARSLLEILAEASADIRQGVEPQLRDKERNLQQRINATAERQIKLLSGEHSPEQAEAIKKELEDLLRELEQLRAEIRLQSPRYAALTQPQPLKLEEIKEILDENTLLLEYSLGDKRSFLWAVTPASITTYELPPRAEIDAAVKEFRQIITDPDKSQDEELLAKSGGKLSQLVLAPAAELLGEKRLLIAADGALQYIPFAALSHPEASEYEPLIMRNEIVSLSSASTLAVIRRETASRPVAPQTIALMADPVFDPEDPRLQGEDSASLGESTLDYNLSRSAEDIGVKGTPARLRFTRQEADRILALVPDAEKLSVLDFDASREAVTGDSLGQYRIVHLATHGFMNSLNPELSGIVLSLVDKEGKPTDGFLRLHDIYNLNMPAELIVLSACQTGLGEEIKGEGLVGLTRGFMYAGAPRLVVSLWSVNDSGTAELMSDFYQRYLEDGLRPAAALRAAQLEMWENDRWFAPYYWAAFTFQGEWR